MKQEKIPEGSDLNGHTSVEENGDKGRYSVYEAIEGTPLYIAGKEGEYFLGWGNCKVSPDIATVEGVKQYLEENMLHVVGAMIMAGPILAAQYKNLEK